MQQAMCQFIKLVHIMDRHLEKYLRCQQTGLLVVAAFQVDRTNHPRFLSGTAYSGAFSLNKLRSNQNSFDKKYYLLSVVWII